MGHPLSVVVPPIGTTQMPLFLHSCGILARAT